MNTTAEAADQIVRMSLNGAETALKISGTGAKEIAKLLYAMLKDMNNESKKTKGQIRLTNLLKSGKKLDIYQIPDGNLKKFCTEAKKYGILYTVLKDRNRKDGQTEVMVKAEDKQKLDYIIDKLNMAPFDTEVIREDTVQQMEKEVPERTAPEKDKEDAFLDELMAKPNPTKEEGQNKHPTEARNQNRSRQSVPSSGKRNASTRDATNGERTVTDRERRPSVRKELEDIKREQDGRKERDASRTKSKTTQQKTNKHKAPKRKKSEKER